MGNKGSLLGLTAVCIFGSIIFTNLGAMVGLWVLWVRGSANSGELAGGSKVAASGVVGSSKLVLGAGGDTLSDQVRHLESTSPHPHVCTPINWSATPLVSCSCFLSLLG